MWVAYFLNSGIFFLKKTNSVDFFYISDPKTENVTHYTWDHSNIVNYLPVCRCTRWCSCFTENRCQATWTGYFTNHSLRATAATRLYDAGVDEQLITEKTGHRSSAVRSYKRTQDAQLVKISEIIQGSEKWNVNQKMLIRKTLKKQALWRCFCMCLWIKRNSYRA